MVEPVVVSAIDGGVGGAGRIVEGPCIGCWRDVIRWFIAVICWVKCVRTAIMSGLFVWLSMVTTGVSMGGEVSDSGSGKTTGDTVDDCCAWSVGDGKVDEETCWPTKDSGSCDPLGREGEATRFV